MIILNRKAEFPVLYLENAVPRTALSAHFPDFLNVFIRDLPSKPEAPVIRTEQPEETLTCKAAIITRLKLIQT